MANDSPVSILFDDLGNPVGVTSDGYVYRLQTEATISNVVKIDGSLSQVKTEYDISSSTVNYIGTAVSGTATSAAAWTIKKITFDASGNPLEILWSNNTAIWDNRATTIYS